MLPIENSLHGPVAETHDLLYEAPLSIVSEVTLPIVHCLLANSADPGLARCETLRSHPVAFDQCRELVRTLARALHPAATTADAAREVAESDDPTEAAIASAEAAARYGLHVIAPRRRRPSRRSRASSRSRRTRASTAPPRWRTALSFVTDHRPGSLYHALGPFHRHGLNLVQLVSRPIPQSTFRYRFDMVLDGHPLDAELQPALVEMREWTREVRIFGSYPRDG